MGRLALILLAGCGRIAFDPFASGNGDGGNGNDDSTGDVAGDSETPDPALLIHFDMDGIANNILVDSSGNAHNATCTACPSPTFDLVRGGVTIFDGIDDLFTIPPAADLRNLTEMTVSYWVNQIDNNSFQCIFGKRLGTGINNSWQTCIDASQIVFFYVNNGAMQVQAVTGTGAITAGTWAHVALRWVSSGSMNVFVDGVNKANANAGIAWNDGELTLGGDIDNTMPLALFTGALDEIRVYGRALTDLEIMNLADQ